MRGRLVVFRIAIAIALAVVVALSGTPADGHPARDIFADAARAHGVPRELLVALGRSETHLDGHGGQPSADGGYGVMHLVSNPDHHTLDEAAALTHHSRQALRTEDAANVDGAAAVLRDYANEARLTAAQRADVGAWRAILARYGGATDPAAQRLYTDAVYALLPRAPAVPRQPAAEAESLAEYPPAHWIAASPANYRVADRPPSAAITTVVIHVTQGSYAGTIAWFQNPKSQVSAHYVVRSSDGDITQMVREKDVAWHARSGNGYAIGIEHEGFVSDPTWFTDVMYRASAALTRHLCDKYGIAKDRKHIVGHSEVPGNDHTDPGKYWDWPRYMRLVNSGSAAWTTTVDNATGGFRAGANWGVSSYYRHRFGADYRYATPLPASDLAWFRARLPVSGSYRVDVWYPVDADAGFNDRTPFLANTTTGLRTTYVNQRIGGGRWIPIGTFTFAAGEQNVLAVSRWTGGTGLVIADAIRLTKI